MSSLDAFIARTMEDLSHSNTLAVPHISLRFQLAPGTANGLGVEGVPFSVTFNGEEFKSGDTDSDGEVTIPAALLAIGSVTLTLLDTDYNLTLHPGLQPNNALNGQQKRMDVLGYVTGYQLDPIQSAPPDDNIDGPRTQQSIMNFQTDSNLAIDGDIGAHTSAALLSAAGE